MRLNSGPLEERYTREVDTRVAADLASGLGKPTKEEHLVARLSLLPERSEDEASIAAALNEALRWGRPMEGAKLQQERVAVLHRLGTAGDTDRWWDSTGPACPALSQPHISGNPGAGRPGTRPARNHAADR